MEYNAFRSKKWEFCAGGPLSDVQNDRVQSQILPQHDIPIRGILPPSPFQSATPTVTMASIIGMFSVNIRLPQVTCKGHYAIYYFSPFHDGSGKRF